VDTNVIGLLIIIGLIPIRPFARLIPDYKYDLVITGQEMGCPCPDFRIIKGELNIPNCILINYSNLYKDEINLTQNSLFKEYNYEIAHSQIYVNGNVVSVEHVSDDDYTPVFDVKNWKVKSYIPIFWTFGRTKTVLYLIFGVSGSIYFLITLTILIIKRIRIKTAYNRSV